MKITGGCQCGAVRYEIEGPLPHAYACHCGDCRTRMWHSKANPAEQINLKAGTLDDPSSIRISGHLWLSRKSPGFDIAADAVRHDTQPDDLRGWYVSLAGEKI